MKAIAVFCGSGIGTRPEYAQSATRLGQLMAERNINLVYGGASIGLMGAVADAVMSGGSKVYGVIPAFLADKEIAHKGLTELFVVEDMHIRKFKMAEMADAFVALPGGFGTLEELFEVLTWSQLSLHTKPIAVLNLNGFYDGVLAQCKTMVEHGFLKQATFELIRVAQSPEELLEVLK
jgi:uncharacterized protein (TIGR00730 family)